MEDLSRIENLYERFTEGFLRELNSDQFYGFFMNMIKSSPSAVSLYEKYIQRDIDMRWVEAIEECIIPLDNIIRNPIRFIRRDEDIVPIEMSRQIETESIRHLAQHTNMIASVKDGRVTPSKILNVTKEESFETYENRFIYTLLLRIQYFLDKRLENLFKDSAVADQFEYRANGSCEAGHDNITYSFAMSYTTPHVELDDNELISADVSKLDDLQRIERLKKILFSFQQSPLIKSLKGCAQVRPPLTMTNVLTKNQNFKKAVSLWAFISNYDETGYALSYVERQSIPSPDYINEMFSLVALQYVMMKKHTRHVADGSDYVERRREMKPRMIRNIIDDAVKSYDLSIDEVRRVFTEELEKKSKKENARFARAKEILARSMAEEKETAAAENKARDDRQRRLSEERRREQRKAEQLRIRQEKEKQRLEQIRLEEEARLAEEARKAEEARLLAQKAAKEAEEERLRRIEEENKKAADVVMMTVKPLSKPSRGRKNASRVNSKNNSGPV